MTERWLSGVYYDLLPSTEPLRTEIHGIFDLRGIQI